MNIAIDWNEAQKHLRQPAPDTALYRYMDLGKFISLIAFKKLYMSSASEFEDIYDSISDLDALKGNADLLDSIAKNYNLEIGEEPYHLKEELLVFLDKVKKSTRISCWHMNTHLSEAMWKLYSKDVTSSVAIKTSYKKIASRYGNCDYLLMGLVDYIDYNWEFPCIPYNYWKKRKAFDHENEFRIVRWTENYGEMIWNADGSVAKTKSINDSLHFPTELIEAVIVSPYANPYMKAVVKSIMMKYDVHCVLWHLDEKDCSLIYSY